MERKCTKIIFNPQLSFYDDSFALINPKVTTLFFTFFLTLSYKISFFLCHVVIFFCWAYGILKECVQRLCMPHSVSSLCHTVSKKKKTETHKQTYKQKNKSRKNPYIYITECLGQPPLCLHNSLELISGKVVHPSVCHSPRSQPHLAVGSMWPTTQTPG